MAVTIKDHIFQPWLIITCALFALLLTTGGLSLFLEDWAKRGQFPNIQRVGLFKTCTGETCMDVERTTCPANDVLPIEQCLTIKNRIQAVTVLVLVAFVVDIFGFLMTMPILLGRWVSFFGVSCASVSCVLHFIAMCVFLSISRNYYEAEDPNNFFQLSSGFGLCVVNWILAVIVAATAFLAWDWQARKWLHGRYCKFLC